MLAKPLKPVRTETTHDRLIAAARELFAQKGFDATTVGEIEAAAGLQPRRGALYRHFDSKEDLLEAAVARHLDAVSQVSLELSFVNHLDAKSVALIYGKWLLNDLDNNRQLTAIFEREGERMTELRDRFEKSVDIGFRSVADVISRWNTATEVDLDADVVAAVLTGSIVNHRRALWTLGAPPLGLEDDRFIAGWAQLIAHIYVKAE